MNRGIIVSIQGYSESTTQELADNCINGGAVALRTDKKINSSVQLIGLFKLKKVDYEKRAYITPSVEDVKRVEAWTNHIAIDYRALNKNLLSISEYCREKKITVIADIQNINDYKNIIEHKYYYTYIATTLSVLQNKRVPDIELIKEIMYINNNELIIGEGNFKTRMDVKEAFKIGVQNVCIGGAISDVYKLTRKYTSVLMGGLDDNE